MISTAVFLCQDLLVLIFLPVYQCALCYNLLNKLFNKESILKINLIFFQLFHLPPLLYPETIGTGQHHTNGCCEKSLQGRSRSAGLAIPAV